MKKQKKLTRRKTKTSTMVPKETLAPQADQGGIGASAGELEALRESEQRIRTLFDSTSDMAFLKDERFRHIIVNHALCKFHGKTESEILGKTDFDLMAEKAAAECRKTDEQILLSNTLMISEEFVGGRYYETRKFPVEIAVGKRGIGAYIRDITERKLAEEALRESEENYRFLFENAGEGIFLAQGDVIKFANQACAGILGYSSDIITTRPFSSFIHPEDSAMVADRHLRRMRGEPIETGYRFRIIAADGTVRWLYIISRVLSWEGMPASLSFVMDITDQKRAEEELRESEERYRNLFENAHEAIFVAQDGNLVFLNSRTSTQIGYSVEELKSKSFIELIHPDDQEMVIDNHIKRMKGEEIPNIYAFRVMHRDGSVQWVELNAVSINWKGKPATLNFMTDITERKKAEEDILRLNAELENKVAKRTNELHDSQLALLNLVDDLNQSAKNITLANQALEATNKELESFSYSVSHDLRAPLRSIDGFSQALLEDYQKKLDDTGRNYLERIRTATQNMGMLIEDMLKLSRISRFELRLKSVDLSKMFREIAKNSQKNDPARIIDVVIQKGIVIEGDPDLMRIALTNLIDNAWKFTGREAQPKIEFGRTDLAGKKVVFIRDNGVGFDMAYVDKLFGTFQRLHTKDEFAGTGIGLATVKRIITRHGGQIWAEGEVGKGATFFFTLPA